MLEGPPVKLVHGLASTKEKANLAAGRALEYSRFIDPGAQTRMGTSSIAPQTFPRPDLSIADAGARRACQGLAVPSAATVRLGLYTTEHDGSIVDAET